jgi:hypothetical protein
VAKNGDPNGLLRSLAGMPGARARTQESVHFEVNSIEEAVDRIKELQGTGALTINFQGGKPRQAEWKTGVKDRPS